MSRPELKFELDEYGRIVYRVTDEGVLLSKDEKEFIIDHVTRMQAENAKLRDELEDERSENGWALEFMNRMGEKVRCSDAANLKEYVEGLERENAKLRELVRDMAAEIRGLGVDFARVGWCDYADRMRELGVEVDG